jgi:hypothetical protein
MPSSKPNATNSPNTSTKPQKALGLEEHADQNQKQAIENLNRLRRSKQSK